MPVVLPDSPEYHDRAMNVLPTAKQHAVLARAALAAAGLVLYLAAVAGCRHVHDSAAAGTPQPAGPGAGGTLGIAFTLADVKGVVPSYQTAVWLTAEDGGDTTSLFVSEYLAYGGYKHPNVCAHWVKAADWENASDAEFDAVTGPTPSIGRRALSVDCAARGIPPGTYRYHAEVHIVADFTVLATGAIEIGRGAAESAATITCLPRKHAAAGQLLTDVTASFTPGAL
jgi:hypothetical protein